MRGVMNGALRRFWLYHYETLLKNRFFKHLCRGFDRWRSVGSLYQLWLAFLI